jgi:hypothetical protein
MPASGLGYSETHASQWAAEDGVTVATRPGLDPAWNERRYRPEDLWAYQPVSPPQDLRSPVAPAARPPETDSEPPSHVSPARAAIIDQLLALHEPPDLPVAPPADRLTLIRRASFDLTGLPPLPKEIDAFLADPAADEVAFAQLVDRLLASPHYGERMAQHWLDVVRYADSAGLANDYHRGNAWRYRDYIVRSFNDDKPYDLFIRQQLAGDELDGDDTDLSERLIATGFLRMGPWELTGMEVAKVARQQYLDDVTNAVGETFLAQSLQCARCHDHKFDPVPTADYYAMQAVFATTQLAERPAPFLPRENQEGFEEGKYLERQRQDHLATLRRLDQQLLAAAESWFREQISTAEAVRREELVAGLGQWRALVESLQESRQEEQGAVFAEVRRRLLQEGASEDRFPPKFVGFAPDDYGNQRVAQKGLERLRWELESYEPFALSVYSGHTPALRSVTAPLRVPERRDAGELEQTAILLGGDPFSPGKPVAPGPLSAVSSLPAEWADVPDSVEGRRRALADWIAHPANPLTTRAIANRIWLWHFHRPLAGNPNNFGVSGARPTHPELLDWLAAELVRQHWSLKALHRLIMNSEAYRRSSDHPDISRLAAGDPRGDSYAVFRPRRLTAEEIRDAMLVATGELNRTVGGIPNRPEIHPEVALQPRQVMGTFAAAWVPNPLPHQRHRRSLYTLKLRGLRDPFREVFNEPSPDFSCERREDSIVTPQVFSLLNGQAIHDRALALARRVIDETDSDEQAVHRLFQRVYGRSPAGEEHALCLQHWRAMEPIQQQVEQELAPRPSEVRREAIEENTGETFEFVQPLYSHEDFVPDLQPGDVDARTRALADVCLALLNSNEFVYVY